MIKNILVSSLLNLFIVTIGFAITLSPTGRDDTQNFIDAFNGITSTNNAIYIKEGSYTINQSMPVLSSRVTILGQGRPRINLMGNITFLKITNRGTQVKDITIKGEPSRISRGILVQNTSWIALDNIEFIDLDVGLEFQYAHDFKSLGSLSFYHNKIDFEVNKYTDTLKPSTSFTFINCRMETSDKSILIETDVTNFGFIGCGFAAIPTIDSKPIEIKGLALQGIFKNNRFEYKGSTIDVDGIYFKGSSSGYPAQSIHIEDNYFTGSNINNFIRFDNWVKNINIENNHFQTTPSGCDIYHKTNYPVNIDDNYTFTNHSGSRPLKIGTELVSCP